MLFCWIQTFCQRCHVNFQHIAVGLWAWSPRGLTALESCFLQALLAKLGFQALCRETQHLEKQAVLVPQQHTGAHRSLRALQMGLQWGSAAVELCNTQAAAAWASPLPFLLEISCARSSGGFFLNPKISGFEGFVNFWLHFVIKSTFRRRRLMHHQQKHFRELDVFHDRTFARFALDFGASTGAGLLKAEGMLYFRQS